MKIGAGLALALAALPLPITPSPDIDVDIIGFDHPVHTAGANLQVDLSIDHPSARDVDARVTFSFGDRVPSSRSALDHWVSDDGTEVSEAYSTEITLEPGQDTYSVTIPSEAIPWGNTAGTWGPRGIEARIDTDGSSGADRSLLVIAPSFELEPMGMTTIVPVTTGATQLIDMPDVADMIRANLSGTTTDFLADALSPATSAATARVSDLARPGVTLALDSQLLDPGIASQPDLLGTLDSFADQRDSEIVLLPALDADLTAWSVATRKFYDPALEALTTAEQTLADRGIDSRSDVLLPSTKLTANIADIAADLNMNLVVGSTADAPLVTEQYWTPTPTVDLGGIDGVLTDADMTALLNETTNDPGQSFDRQQKLLALSAVHYRERPNDPRPFVLEAHRTNTDFAEVVRLIAVLGQAPWNEPTTLSRIAKADHRDLERQPLPRQTTEQAADLDNVLSQASESIDRISAIASLTTTPAAYMGPVDLAATALTSHAWQTTPTSQLHASGELVKLADDLATSIAAETSSTINIISQDTEFPVRVTSTLPSDAEVTVSLTSSDRRLRFTPTQATLGAESTTTVKVPVTAVGSGNVQVTVEVLNSEGVSIGSLAEIDVRVRADWESLGTGIFAGFFAIILVIGIIRSAKKGTRTAPMPEVVAEQERQEDS